MCYVHDHSRISSAVFEFRRRFLQQVETRKLLSVYALTLPSLWVPELLFTHILASVVIFRSSMKKNLSTFFWFCKLLTTRVFHVLFVKISNHTRMAYIYILSFRAFQFIFKFQTEFKLKRLFRNTIYESIFDAEELRTYAMFWFKYRPLI